MRSISHEAPRTSRGKRASLLGLVALAALLPSGIARADEPVPAPTEQAPALPPPATSEATTPAPAAPPKGSLPESVRAMVGQPVVLQLKSGRMLHGRLTAAEETGFLVEKPDGITESVPRALARSIRLAGPGDSQNATGPAAPYTGPTGREFGRSGEDAAPEGEEPEIRGPQRVFGVGTSFGGGVAGADSFSGSSGTGPLPALLLPTLELSVFLPHEFSLQLVLPVLNMAVTSAVAGGALVNMDLLFKANVGSGKARFVAGAGFGFSYLEVRSDSAASLRIPGQLGFELLSKKRGFGFGMSARPWAEIATGSSSDAVGGGLLGVLTFTGYVTDRTGAGDP